MARQPVQETGAPGEAGAKTPAQPVYVRQAVGFFIGLEPVAS